MSEKPACRWLFGLRVPGPRGGGGGGSRQGSARLVLSLPLSSLIESRHREFQPGDQWSCLHPGFLAVAAQRQGDRGRSVFPPTVPELAPSRGPGVTLRGTRRTPCAAGSRERSLGHREAWPGENQRAGGARLLRTKSGSERG